ncbi:nucleotidyltransferase domain-containing protein [Geotalea sp. SG265]|uniref:GSU2403 family nucleotidyltransferase fold protein n=1 Tax=Geotalea sp. SG265 TaxID=2922867 RepID=UPI001FAF1CD6|nr:nucleotidyltransferase domain-containing protein [Geotalea sp. SG265]
MNHINRVDIQTRTLYAELLEMMQILEASRTISDLNGNFTTKTIGGEQYVYFSHYLPGGKLHYVYVGKKNEQTDALIQRYKEGKPESQEARENIRRLGAQVKAGFGVVTDKAMVRVIKALAEAAVFRAGAVVIGRHAFTAIGVMLGIRRFQGTILPMDVDLSAERSVSVALPQTQSDIPDVIDSLKMGFFPVPALNLKHPSTMFTIRKSQLRLDILTPKTSDSDAPVMIPRFNCAAQPLSYLNYLVEDMIPAVLIDTDPVLVNVPHPARYALHKLIISQVRDITQTAKANKDLLQAYQILSALHEERPDDILTAWANLVSCGPRWKRFAEAGLEDMGKEFGSKVIDRIVNDFHDQR